MISLHATGKCNAVDTLDMTSNEEKMGPIGCLVGHATNFHNRILDSGNISKHLLKEEIQKLPGGSY